MKTKKQINFFKFVLITFCILMSMRATIVSAASSQTNGYVFQLATTADTTVFGGADIPFSNNGSMSGISHIAGTTIVIVPNSGFYKIDYNTSITAGVGACLAVAVNGAVDPSTPTSVITSTGEVSGSVILQLAAGDIITLRNNSAVLITLALAPSVGAQMSITEVTGTYGNINQLATIADAVVVGGADVPFSNNGPMSGISHTAGTTTVTVPNSGCYKIDYNASITAGVGACLAVAVNGTVDPSTLISVLTSTGEVSGSVILQLAAGDVVTLRNNSAIPLILGSAPSVGAQMSITEVTGTYGNINKLATIEDATVFGGADIPFSNNGSMSGISHNAGNTIIIVQNAGCYKIDYNVSITAGVGAQLAVAVNGTVDASTPKPMLTSTGEVSGSAIMQLAAGDIITLRNNSLVPITLALAPSVGAQMQVSLIPPAASSDCDITTWTAPANPAMSGVTASKTVPNAATSLVVDVAVSANATWKLYSDSGCSTEITNKTMLLNVGANTAYIKVTAEDGTTKTYTVTITREAAAAVNVTLTAGKGLVRIMTGKPQYANAKIPFVIDSQSFFQNPTGYSFDVIYDPTKVETVTVDSSNSLTKPTVGAPVDADGSNKKVTVTWNGNFTGQDLNSIYNSSKGVLFRLNFLANQDFTSGETPIEIGTGGSFTFASGSSSITGTSGKIISGIIYGDVNGDGAITSSDTNLINKYVSGKITAILGDLKQAAADVNGDGIITAADAKEISNYISGKSSTLKTLFGY